MTLSWGGWEVYGLEEGLVGQIPRNQNTKPDEADRHVLVVRQYSYTPQDLITSSIPESLRILSRAHREISYLKMLSYT